jgi:hypothetical protein
VAPRNANGCIGEGPTDRDRVSGEISYSHYTLAAPKLNAINSAETQLRSGVGTRLITFKDEAD